MSPIEATAVVFGVLCVWLTLRQNIWCWPTGLVQVILYIYIFYEAKLYSDVILQVIYVFLQLYGWYHWLNGSTQGQPLPVSRISTEWALGWTAVAAAGTAGLGFGMHRYTDAALPYWDAAIAVMSLIAQYLLACKVLESWLVWIAVDVIAIFVYAAKGLHLTAGLYGVFLCLAVMGFFAWKRALPVPAAA